MTDLIYRPEADNRNAPAVVTVCFFIACAALIPGMMGIGYQLICQSVILVSVSLGVYFSVRYFLSYRSYSLTYLNARHVLLVTDTQGKRISTVCNIRLDEVTEIRCLTRNPRAETVVCHEDGATTGGKARKYIYQNVLRPSSVVRITVPDGMGGICQVRLQTNEVFLDALLLRVKTAKAERVTDNEEG